MGGVLILVCIDVDSFVGRSHKRICLDRFVSNARIRSDRMD